jgi:RecG-like helicase
VNYSVAARLSERETPLCELDWRTRATVRGRVQSMRVQPWGDVASLECVVVDETGGILLVFFGRRKIAGVELGRELIAEGMVGQSRGYLAVLNPDIELIGS